MDLAISNYLLHSHNWVPDGIVTVVSAAGVSVNTRLFFPCEHCVRFPARMQYALARIRSLVRVGTNVRLVTDPRQYFSQKTDRWV